MRTYILWKNSPSRPHHPGSKGFSWKRPRGLGLRGGKFCVRFSLEEAGDGEGQGQHLGWEMGSHPALLCTCLSQSREAIGSGVSLWAPIAFGSCPGLQRHPTHLPPPGGSRTSPPTSRIQSVRDTWCLRRGKTWAMSQSESLQGWQSGRGVVMALPAMSPAPRLDCVRGGSGWRQPNTDMK